MPVVRGCGGRATVSATCGIRATPIRYACGRPRRAYHDPPPMRTDELDYHLPPELIATQPAHPRDAARLMVIHRATETVHHRQVFDLTTLIAQSSPIPGPGAGDLLVFNRSRVLPARFDTRRVATGGSVTGLYLSSRGRTWQAMLESGGRLRPGERLGMGELAELELVRSLGGGAWEANLLGELETFALLERIGQPPLPPYIRKARRERAESEISQADTERYNTVFAAEPGSVAAPTAGLHFTPALLADLESRGVRLAYLTLHVGLGTFAPVRSDQLEDHAIHEEWVSIPAETIAALREVRRAGGRIIPVGTTSVRALESLAAELPPPGRDWSTSTSLFITPRSDHDGAFPFRFTDALLTNFHLPRSTLLALVAALPGVGIERLLGWYRIAIDHEYRFYSYGDAMLLV